MADSGFSTKYPINCIMSPLNIETGIAYLNASAAYLKALFLLSILSTKSVKKFLTVLVWLFYKLMISGITNLLL